jgi:pimeloyl-ACP methyl ester carboxylesterase
MAVKLILLVLLLAALPVGLVAACGRAFLYHPTHLGPRHLRALAAQSGWKLEPISVRADIELQGLVRPPTAANATWVLFFGGNAMGLAAGHTILELLAEDADLGLAVWAYRGYDGSGGHPTEASLLQDAEAQIAHLQAAHGVLPSSLLLVGQSLGSGIAAHASAQLHEAGSPARGLLLLSPYTSIARVVDDTVPFLPVGWAMADSYRTDQLAARIPGPVLIVHGDADTLIRPRHGEQLAQLLGQRAELFWASGAGHNDLWGHAASVRRMRAFVRSPGTATPDAGPRSR